MTGFGGSSSLSLNLSPKITSSPFGRVAFSTFPSLADSVPDSGVGVRFVRFGAESTEPPAERREYTFETYRFEGAVKGLEGDEPTGDDEAMVLADDGNLRPQSSGSAKI